MTGHWGKASRTPQRTGRGGRGPVDTVLVLGVQTPWETEEQHRGHCPSKGQLWSLLFQPHFGVGGSHQLWQETGGAGDLSGGPGPSEGHQLGCGSVRTRISARWFLFQWTRSGVVDCPQEMLKIRLAWDLTAGATGLFQTQLLLFNLWLKKWPLRSQRESPEREPARSLGAS